MVEEMFTQGGLKIRGQFRMKEMWKQLQIVKEMNGKDEENFKMLPQYGSLFMLSENCKYSICYFKIIL